MKSPRELRVQLDAGATTSALVYPATTSLDAVLILGHGAGAGQLSPFMVEFARDLSELGIDTVTFNFPYTEQHRRLPDRGPVLTRCYRAVTKAIRQQVVTARQALFIGGKSMGGRIATELVAADRDVEVEGLVLLGYPLHPPGRPEQRRDRHLPAVGHPMLVVQGTRDTFGTPDELSSVFGTLAPPATLHTVNGGDHSFRVSGKDPERQKAVYEEIQRAIVTWIRETTRDHSSVR